MQAKHQVPVSQTQQAQVARLLLQANLAYGESNSNGVSHIRRLKSRQECRGYLNEALALEPTNAGALGLLGRVEIDDGQFEKAHKLFNASLDHQPGQAQQYCNLGYWALKTERPALAERYFLQALEDKLTELVGPAGSLLIEDAFSAMGMEPESLARDEIPQLLQEIGTQLDADERGALAGWSEEYRKTAARG